MTTKSPQLSLFPKRPYNQPGEPAEYSQAPEDLPNSDAEWMRSLDKKLWTACAPDRFGHVHYVDEGHILKADMEKIFGLIRRCKLLTTMGCGTFGLAGYSMTVWMHPPCLGADPEPLCTLTDGHLPEPPKSLVNQFENNQVNRASWEQAWLLFSQFTHSPVNREMLALYHGKSVVKSFGGKKVSMPDTRFEPPRERSSYDY